ncbi:CHASE3 domain-containing protein [Falsochrobactrum sp. TDYN1]|uniref:histidine kinase n=1 Tax=Falsochrobactrum tianjinense TaxID=2706015 RepID=A0A949UVW6_9HYPH|nr:CHASE3 domain-containing protein [Falsochrobactrum sp. TDYN1]MBV2144691.1 CHASE3 domain-containing protein [Falsochrobactrum sp. TDYN1]
MSSAFSQHLFKPSLRPLAVIVSLGLVLLSAAMTLFLSMSVNKQVVDIARNFDLRQQVEKVAQLTYNIEMSRRGYLLTLDETYLDLYQRSVLSIDQTLSELALLTQNNSQQDARVQQISALVDREHEDVRQTINLAKEGKVDEAIEKVRGDEGKVLIDQLSNTVSQFTDIEERELFKRNAHINRIRYWMAATSIVALASAVILGLLLFSRIQRYARALIDGQSALLSEKELLEKRVQERTAELDQERRIAERERQRVEILLQDSNHRIGNSLATVSSLLGLQLRQIRNEEARAALSAARDRVQTVSTAHRRLRLGEDMESTRVDEFLATVIDDIRNAIGSDGKISFETDFAPLDLKARDVTTIGIIVGELITNAVKHAFRGRKEGRVLVRFVLDESDHVPALVVEDNGVGWQGKDLEKPGAHNGLGMLVVEQLCMQFGDKPIYAAMEDGTGTRVTVRLSSLAQGQLASCDALPDTDAVKSKRGAIQG